MKQSKISRRSFLLGLGAVSAAAVLTACGGSSSASTAASGSAASGSSVVYRTLDQIKESGTINIGVFSDKNPFGYVDENGEYQGYDVYFARRLGEDLGVEAVEVEHQRDAAHQEGEGDGHAERHQGEQRGDEDEDGHAGRSHWCGESLL